MSILNQGHARHGVTGGMAPNSGRYYGTRSCYGGSGTTVVLAADTPQATPFYLPGNTTTDRLALNISATGTATLMRLAVYTTNDLGQPGALLVETGALDPTGTGIKGASTVISQALAGGVVYWLSVIANGSVTVAAVTPPIGSIGAADGSGVMAVGWSRTQAYGAFPAAWGTPVTPLAVVPAILVRVV